MKKETNKIYKKLIIFVVAAFMVMSVASTVHAATGDDCSDPIVVTIPADLDYSDIGQTTCGRIDDYSDTGLGSYDGGEDIIYELDVTAATTIEVTVTSTDTWIGVGVFDACPDSGTLLASDTGSSGPWFFSVSLGVGTYYLMVDSWPSPDCVDFDLSIVEDIILPGETCDMAVPVTAGTYTAPGQPYWYEFTATVTGTAIVTSDLPGAFVDTYLYIYDECSDWASGYPYGTQVGGDEVGYCDDYNSYVYYNYASQCEFPITAGEDYKIWWRDAYGSSGFDWMLTEFVPMDDVGATEVLHPDNGDGPGAIIPEVEVTDFQGTGPTADVDIEIYYGPLYEELLAMEDFEGTFPPTGWTVTNDGSTAFGWMRNDFYGRTNYMYSGYCADADADATGSAGPFPMDTSLITPSFSTVGILNPVLECQVYYNYLGGDFADIDISTDGGSNWDNLEHWEEDHLNELISIPLTDYLNEPDCKIRFRYYADSWDWYFLVDDVTVYQPGASTPEYTGSVTGVSVLTGGTTTVTFPSWTPANTGYYSVIACATCTGDVDTSNDCIKVSPILLGDVDATVSQIIAPAPLMAPNTWSPVVEVTNDGDIDGLRIPVHVAIDDPAMSNPVFEEDFTDLNIALSDYEIKMAFNPTVKPSDFDPTNPQPGMGEVKIYINDNMKDLGEDCWTIIDGDNDGTSWHQSDAAYSSAPYSMYHGDDNTFQYAPGSYDILISPRIHVGQSGYMDFSWYLTMDSNDLLAFGNSVTGLPNPYYYSVNYLYSGGWYSWTDPGVGLLDSGYGSGFIDAYGNTRLFFIFQDGSLSSNLGAFIDNVVVTGSSIYMADMSVTLDAGESETLIFPPFTPPAAAGYEFTACTEQCYDEDLTNDCDSLVFSTAAPVYILETGFGYPTIQDGIDAAIGGQTVVATDGTYTEDILIDKPITVTAEHIDSTPYRCEASGYTVSTCTWDHDHSSFIEGTVTIDPGSYVFPPVSECDYTVCLYDTYGDGWNGNIMDVYVDGTLVLDDITLPSGAGPLCFDFTVHPGDTILMDWQYTGSYASECYISVQDSEGNYLVSNYFPYNSGDWQGTGNCPSPTGGTTVFEKFDVNPPGLFTGSDAAVSIYGSDVIVQKNTIHNIGTIIDTNSYYTIKGIHAYGSPSDPYTSIVIQNNTVRDILSENVSIPGGTNTLLSEDFEGVQGIRPLPPPGWLVEDTNGDGYTSSYYAYDMWGSYWYSGYAHSGSGLMRYDYNFNNQANDWVFSPGVSLTAGNTYDLSFWLRKYSSYYTESLDVYLCSAQSSGSIVSILLDIPSIPYAYTDETASFVAPGTGTYYLGFHCYSPANAFYVFLDDVTLTETTAPVFAGYGGATGIMIQGYLDGVDVLNNRVEDIHSAGWCYGVEVTPTQPAGSLESFAPTQVLFESFEDAWVDDSDGDLAPPDWENHITNAASSPPLAAHWNQATTITTYAPPAVPTDGTYQAAVHWDYGHQDEWLVSPEIDLTDCTDTVLTFDFFGHYGSTYLDHYYVKVSPDGGYDTSDFTDTVWDASAQPAGDNHYTTPVTIDLSAYDGETIRIAWNWVDGDGQGLWYGSCIDAVEVTAECGGGPGPGPSPDYAPKDVTVNCNYLTGIGDGTVYDVWNASDTDAPYPGVMFTVDTYTNTNTQTFVSATASEVTLECNYFNPDNKKAYAIINKDKNNTLDARYNFYGTPTGPGSDPINGDVHDAMNSYVADGFGARLFKDGLVIVPPDILMTGGIRFYPWLGAHANIAEPAATITVETGEAVNFNSDDSWAYCFDGCENCCDAEEQVLQYLWDFGDGRLSSNANPAHVFNQPGTYTVSLMVDAAGFAYFTNFMFGFDEVTVIVEDPAPSLTANADGGNLGGYEGAIGETVSFYGSASGGQAPYSYIWDFGDGSNLETTKHQTVTHVYREEGEYTVTLKIVDATSTIATDTSTVQILGMEELFVQITAPNRVNENTVNEFASNVYGGKQPYSYYWDFGDGVISTETSPIHVYENSGTYTLTLRVTDALGTEITKTKTITVGQTTTSEVEITEVNAGLLLTATIESNEQVSWTIDVDGLVFFGGHGEGTAEGNTQIRLPFSIGFGNVDVTITAGAEQKQFTANMFGPFLLNLQEA